MEILICQSCGAILRSQGKSCKDCGAFATRHTSTAIAQVIDPGGSALAVSLQNDPFVLERTVNHILYGRGNNGHGSGHSSAYGGNGNGSSSGNAAAVATAPGYAPVAARTDSVESSYASSAGASGLVSAALSTELPTTTASSNSVQAEQVAPTQAFAPTQTLPQTQAAPSSVAEFRPPLAAVADSAGAMMPSPGSQGDFFASKEAAMAAAALPQNQNIAVEQHTTAAVESTGSEKTPVDSRVEAASQAQNASPGALEPQSATSTGVTGSAVPTEKSQADVAASGVASPLAASPLAASPVAAPPIAAPPIATPPVAAPTEVLTSSPGVALNATQADPWKKTGVLDFFSASAQNLSGRASTDAEIEQAEVAAAVVADRVIAAAAATAATAAAANAANDLSFKPASDQRTNSKESKSEARPNSEKTSLRNSGLQTEKPKALAKSSRLSLSQNSRSKSISGGRAKDDDDDEEEDDEDDDDDDDNDDDDKEREKQKGKEKERPKRLSNLKGKEASKDSAPKVEIMGRSFSRSALITTGVLSVLVGFPFIVLTSCVISIFSNSGSPSAPGQSAGQGAGQSSQSTSSVPSTLTGKWQFEYENIGKGPGHGIFMLTQTGDKLEGSGVDDSGQFEIAGTVQGENAKLNKVYIKDGKASGKPIAYAAKLAVVKLSSGPVMQMLGNWELTKRQGFGWRAQIVTLGGRWGARLTQPGNSTASTISSGPNLASNVSLPSPAVAHTADAGQKDPKKAQNFFMEVAVGIIGIGVLLAMLSLRFFGPSGLLNIWAKKEYIPSQFKAQHFKMVKEMGKPITTGGLLLGTREEWGFHQFWLPRRLAMPVEMRDKNPHLFVLGAGATGKTRLIASMITQDIESGDRAVVVVDSDGGLADLILNWIASRPNGAEYAKRTIVVDPTYREGQPLGFNPLEFPEDGDLQNAASALVFGFKAAYTEPPGAQSQWNQQTANILRNSSILLMANNKTLTDLPVLLSDNDFRDVLLERIEQMKATRSEFITLIDAWANYKRLARTDQWITWIEPILNRVQPMLSDPRIRTILTKEKSELSLKKVISERQVLIIKIPQGQLDKNGNLLGSLMVAGLKQAALSLCARSKYKRRPCSLYLDEFESFIEKETFDAITTETRKLQIGFCGTSKTLQTLPEDFRNTIIINCGIMAIFALAKKDADMLGPQMFRVDGRKIKHQTIQNVFNKVNSSPQFELIMDEEKLNIDRVVGQEKRTYFCYRVGSVAGVFRMKAPDFIDIEEGQVNHDLIAKMHSNRQEDISSAVEDVDEEEDDEEDDDDDEEE